MTLIARTTTAALAVATVSILAVSSAFANSATLTQMQDQLRQELQGVGITDVDFSKLTFTQIADLSAVFDQTGTTDRADAEAILQGPERTAAETLSVRDFPQARQLALMVTNDLKSVGIDDRNVEDMSIGEVQALAEVFSRSTTGTGNSTVGLHDAAMAVLDAHARDAVLMKTVADFPKATEMERMVVADLGTLGIEVAHPEKLTLEQLSQISEAFDSMDSAADRTAAITRILGTS